MNSLLAKTRSVLLTIYYFLRLPFVAIQAIFKGGWSAFWIKFKNWLQVVTSGQLRYEINSRYDNLGPVDHQNSTLFTETIDFIPEIIHMLENNSPTSKPEGTKFIEVIVPIYNAYEDFLKCLYTLLKHQDIYRIILLDDCSPDPNMQEFLALLKKYENQKFTVEIHPQNLGYLNTVNQCMRMTQQDVILLNTDTIVTAGWARKMMICAQSDDRIATVTPFTNNGRMCSIPRFLQANEIPEGFTVDSFATCVEKASRNCYPELITGVGFCMYIRRNAIHDIGYFDDINFGKGYGEEVDFSFRAINQGYKNVLCDNTFVFHKGNASFLDSQRALMEKNHIYLSEKYPEYWAAIANFERANPLREIHDSIKREMKARRFQSNTQ